MVCHSSGCLFEFINKKTAITNRTYGRAQSPQRAERTTEPLGLAKRVYILTSKNVYIFDSKNVYTFYQVDGTLFRKVDDPQIGHESDLY
jgi:hypothetical protein